VIFLIAQQSQTLQEILMKDRYIPSLTGLLLLPEAEENYRSCSSTDKSENSTGILGESHGQITLGFSIILLPKEALF
jgi:hypothetical protein